MEEPRNYLCIEYKNPNTLDFGKYYFSIDATGKINYDTLQLYTLQELEEILKNQSKEEILNQIREDNVWYFLDSSIPNDFFKLKICFFENGKERCIDPLDPECLSFDLETFMKEELDEFTRKKIYNSLGGYLNNSHTLETTKQWIRDLRKESNQTLAINYKNLPYKEQRKIRQIIFNKIEPTKETLIRAKVA